MVFNQTFTHGFFLIVFTGSQFFTGNVVFAFYFRRIEFNVINTTRRRMNAAADDTINDQFVRYVEFQNVINIDARFFHRVCLRNGTREAVQQETITAVFLSNALFNQRDHQFVGDQFASIHNVFCLFTQLGARFDRSTQHIASGDLRNTIFLHDELSLSPFPRARSAKQNDTHCENPLKMCRIF